MDSTLIIVIIVGLVVSGVIVNLFYVGAVGDFYIVFFFFQAEDGIRDTSVTGVQTCALPISHRRSAPADKCLRGREQRSAGGSGGTRSVGYCARALQRHLCRCREKDQGTAAFKSSVLLRTGFLARNPSIAFGKSILSGPHIVSCKHPRFLRCELSKILRMTRLPGTPTLR